MTIDFLNARVEAQDKELEKLKEENAKLKEENAKLKRINYEQIKIDRSLQEIQARERGLF